MLLSCCIQGELDAVENKQQFNAQLLKANTDAAEFKAMYDKVRLFLWWRDCYFVWSSSSLDCCNLPSLATG